MQFLKNNRSMFIRNKLLRFMDYGFVTIFRNIQVYTDFSEIFVSNGYALKGGKQASHSLLSIQDL